MSINYLELRPAAIATHQLRGGQNGAIRERIRNAKIIFGLDSDSMKVEVLFGRALIQQIIDEQNGTIKESDIASIVYDATDHDDLEIVRRFVRIIKGEPEYEPQANTELSEFLVIGT